MLAAYELPRNNTDKAPERKNLFTGCFLHEQRNQALKQARETENKASSCMIMRSTMVMDQQPKGLR
jgi:hypothetical protein